MLSKKPNPEARPENAASAQRNGQTGQPELDVDRLLSEHFASALDAQRGRAAAGFSRWVADHPAGQKRMPRQIVPRRIMPWRTAASTAMVAAVAAAVAIAIFIPRRGAGPTPPAGAPTQIVSNPSLTAESAVPVELGVHVSYRDAGMFMMDDHTPVQKLLRHRVDSVRRRDPADHATIEMDSPADEIVLAAMQKQ